MSRVRLTGSCDSPFAKAVYHHHAAQAEREQKFMRGTCLKEEKKEKKEERPRKLIKSSACGWDFCFDDNCYCSSESFSGE
jgi:hypothetical protein